MDDQTPIKKQSLRPVDILLLLLATTGVALGAYSILREPEATKPQEHSHTIEKDDTTDAEDDAYGGGTVLESGLGGFDVVLPDGWGPVLNDTTRDYMLIRGTTQPTLKTGADTMITEEEFGFDGPTVFGIILSDTAASPDGVSTDYLLVNGKDNSIQGKKYASDYSEDTPAELGGQRLKGDRDYTYVFPYGDKELQIRYSVYGEDPRNLSTTVDSIVDSIILN